MRHVVLPRDLGNVVLPRVLGNVVLPRILGNVVLPKGFWGAWLLGPKVYRNLRFYITRRKTILKALDEIYILAVSKRDLESSAWDICSINYMRHWIREYPFSWTVAHRGRQSWQAYKITQTTKRKYKY